MGFSSLSHITYDFILLETDASLQPGQPPGAGIPGQAQFRQPLPPNAGNVRLMNPQLGQVPQQGQQMRPGQVSSGNPMSMPTRPGTFLLVQRQPSNPARARMMMVQQGQGQHRGLAEGAGDGPANGVVRDDHQRNFWDGRSHVSTPPP